MKDVLCFSNELDFTENINIDQIEKSRCVKQRLVIEFEEFVFKFIDALNINDEMSLINMVNNLDGRLEKTNYPQELILCLISYKHFVDTNEHVIEH